MYGAIAQGVGSIAQLGLGIAQMNQAKKEAQANRDLQREFAQNSIQWKVADAKKAGLHPLYALGSNGASYTPTQTDSMGYDTISRGIAGGADAVSNYAQIKRQKEFDKLDLERKRLENDLLRTQISAHTNGTGNSNGQHSAQMEEVNKSIAFNNQPVNVNKKGVHTLVTGISDPKDLAQIYTENLTENPNKSLVGHHFNRSPLHRKYFKLDYLPSLAGAPVYIPKELSTEFDILMDRDRYYRRRFNERFIQPAKKYLKGAYDYFTLPFKLKRR